MISDFILGHKAQPLTPDGWVFIVDAIIIFMKSIDEQRNRVRFEAAEGERSFRSTYRDLQALDPRSKAGGEISVKLLPVDRVEDVQRSAYLASDLIAKACLAGRIQSATRKVSGGPLVDLPAFKWGLDDPWPRFLACQMDPQYPFALNMGHWIFFEAQALYVEVDTWRKQWGLKQRWTLPDTRIANEAPTAQDMPALQMKEEPQTGAAPKQGRKPKVGGYVVADQPLLEEMRRLILNGEASCAWDAAGKLVAEAKGASDDAKKKRLSLKYNEKYAD